MAKAAPDAAALAESGDWAGCLSALLATWREARSPELAALIERVSPRAAGPPVGASGSVTAAVRKRIATATDIDVAPIIELALREMRTFPRAYRWVVELAEARPPDPRIATALVEIIKFSPFVRLRGNQQGALERGLVPALDAIDDPRYRPFLVEESRRLEESRHLIRRYKPALDQLAKVAAAIAKRERPREASIAPLAKRIDTALASKPAKQRQRAGTVDELYAAVYADPADLSLRAVLADVLQEAGDPHGEFIALQLGRAPDAAPSKRERELLKGHARAWLGELDPIIRKQGLVFSNGFPARAREGLKYTKHYALFASPRWTTFDTLDFHSWGDNAVAFLLDPRWKILRRVYGVQCSATLEPLARGNTQLPWTAVGPRYPTERTFSVIADLLPDLVELDLAMSGSDVAATIGNHVAKGPLGSRIARCRASSRGEDVGAIIRAVTPQLELELVRDYTFPGDPEGESVRVKGGHVTFVHHGAKIDLAYAATILPAIPTIESVAVEAPPKAKIDEKSWSTVRGMLAKRHVELAR
jgi:uncharacterized protein (TIGR02996 family)